jgi:hypothetical protein
MAVLKELLDLTQCLRVRARVRVRVRVRRMLLDLTQCTSFLA